MQSQTTSLELIKEDVAIQDADISNESDERSDENDGKNDVHTEKSKPFDIAGQFQKHFEQFLKVVISSFRYMLRMIFLMFPNYLLFWNICTPRRLEKKTKNHPIWRCCHLKSKKNNEFKRERFETKHQDNSNITPAKIRTRIFLKVRSLWSMVLLKKYIWGYNREHIGCFVTLVFCRFSSVQNLNIEMLELRHFCRGRGCNTVCGTEY